MVKEMIGKRIQELRISLTGLSQEDFASKLGMDRTYISRVESGKQNLTIDSLCTICYGLGVTLSTFFNPFNAHITDECTSEERNGQR